MTAPDRLAAYVKSIPRTLPDGRVLVHNHVYPQMILGAHGFRAWTAPLDGDPPLMRCPCDWAGMDLHGLAHFIPAGRTMAGRTDAPEFITQVLAHQAARRVRRPRVAR